MLTKPLKYDLHSTLALLKDSPESELLPCYIHLHSTLALLKG